MPQSAEGGLAAGKIWTEGGETVCQGAETGGSTEDPLHCFKAVTT
jgi:hypothetical protein